MEEITEQAEALTVHERACTICQYPPWTFDTDADLENRSFVPGSRYEEIETSAEKGCYGCLLFKEFFDLGTDDPELRHEFTIWFNLQDYFWVDLLRDAGSIQLDVYMLPISTQPKLPNIRIGRMIPEETTLENTLATIKMWLRTCQEKHERCAQPNSYIPPRLLDVGTTESSIKLVETEGFQNTDTDFQYASVSHCWGQTRSKHILNHSNHSINLAGIPVSELPLTFRDAVSITRELGLRYLWIDSLCIVQDDEADWVTHVEAMADVYRNAYITLAAGASLDDDGGFFRDARPTRTHSTPLTIIEEGVSYPLYIRQAIDHPENLWGFSLPLTERGWVFQERVLSRRYLCFGVDEVQWECLEDVACSCSTTGRGFNPRLDERIPRFPACEGTKMWFARLDKLDRENLAELWRNTVTLYSSRKLTYVKDKLPALAGLASYFKEVRKEEYLEGMWQSSLARDLCWLRTNEDENHERFTVIPSWSWAAGAGSVWWSRVVPQNCKWELIGMDKTTLAFKGHLAPVFLDVVKPEDDSDGQRRDCRVLRWIAEKPDREADFETSRTLVKKYNVGEFQGSHLLPLAWPTFQIDEERTNNAAFMADYRYWTSHEELQSVLGNVVLFELGQTETVHVPYGHLPGVHSWAVGLVLQKREKKVGDDQVYERVGLLFYHTGKSMEEWKPVGPYSSFSIT